MDPDGAGGQSPLDRPIARRSVLRGLGAGALAAGASGILAACGSSLKGSGGSSSAGTINIGYITPLTGALAGFGSADKFVISAIRATSVYKSGFKVGGKKYNVNIIVKDSQSSTSRASQVAKSLILNDHVDMILTQGAPETTNPVALACESQGVPNCSTVVPWESWYGGLGGNPAKPSKSFQYSTTFFFGLKQFQGCFVPMWNRIPNNKVVACMYPNDADGNAFRDGFEPLIKASGYTVVDGGAYTDGTVDYTSMISLFKSKNCEIYSNAPLPPDFNAFWKQAHEQGFKPKLATVAKVLLFPADTQALGSLVVNIATDSWWGPYMPYKSSLDGETSSALADAYESQTGNQWVQSIGSSYSLFEVAKEAFSAVSDPHHKAEVAAAMHKVNYTGICGPINFAAGPVSGIGIIEPVGVQWKASTGKYPFEMKVVDNSLNKAVKIGAPLVATNP